MGHERFDGGREGAGYTLVWGTRSVPVLRIWREGLALGRDESRRVPGLVHLFRGPVPVATGLIVSDGLEGAEHRFHFKRLTFCDTAPARDYATGSPAPPPRPGPQRIGL